MADVENAAGGSVVVKPTSKQCGPGTLCAVILAVVLLAGVLVAVLVLTAAAANSKKVGTVKADFGSASDPGGFAPTRRRRLAREAHSQATAGPTPRQLYTNAAGEALAPSVLSFGITRIAICRDLVFSGSRVDGEVDCLELLGNDVLAEAGELRNAAGIAAAYDPTSVVGQSLVNFADPAAVDAALATPADVFQRHLHAYNFGVAYYAPTVMINTDVEMSNGDKLYTKRTQWAVPPTDTVVCRENNASVATSPLSDAPAADSVMLTHSGGAWFKFAQPWNLTAAHFAANATIGLKLAFDLAGMVKGVSTTRCGNTVYDSVAGTDFQIKTTAITLAPVPYIVGQETVKREVYRIAMVNKWAQTNTYDVKLSVYYVEEQAGHPVRAVAGVDMANDLTTTEAKPWSPAAFIAVSGDNTVIESLSTVDGTQFLRSLERGTTVGFTGTAEVRCPFPTECAGAAWESVPYELVAIQTVA